MPGASKIARHAPIYGSAIQAILVTAISVQRNVIYGVQGMTDDRHWLAPRYAIIAKHTKVDMIWVAGRSPTLVSQNLKATTLTYLAIACVPKALASATLR